MVLICLAQFPLPGNCSETHKHKRPLGRVFLSVKMFRWRLIFTVAVNFTKGNWTECLGGPDRGEWSHFSTLRKIYRKPGRNKLQ